MFAIEAQTLTPNSFPSTAVSPRAHEQAFVLRGFLCWRRYEGLCQSLLVDGEIPIYSSPEGPSPSSSDANLAAVAPITPGRVPVTLPGSPGYALYPSAQVPGLETGSMGLRPRY